MPTKANQSFRDYISEIRKLNEFELHKPEDTLRQILSDPQKWAEEYIESNLVRNFRRILEAKRLGVHFAKQNLDSKE